MGGTGERAEGGTDFGWGGDPGDVREKRVAWLWLAPWVRHWLCFFLAERRFAAWFCFNERRNNAKERRSGAHAPKLPQSF